MPKYDPYASDDPNRNKLLNSVFAQPDFSAPKQDQPEEKEYASTKDASIKGMEAVGKGIGSGQSSESTVGDGMIAAGAASGNPYVVAGGVGLKALGASNDAKIAAEEKRKERMIAANQALINIYSSMKL